MYACVCVSGENQWKRSDKELWVQTMITRHRHSQSVMPQVLWQQCFLQPKICKDRFLLEANSLNENRFCFKNTEWIRFIVATSHEPPPHCCSRQVNAHGKHSAWFLPQNLGVKVKGNLKIMTFVIFSSFCHRFWSILRAKSNVFLKPVIFGSLEVLRAR